MFMFCSLRVRTFVEGIAAGLIGIVLYAPFEIVGESLFI
jgi:hypothetical protein